MISEAKIIKRAKTLCYIYFVACDFAQGRSKEELWEILSPASQYPFLEQAKYMEEVCQKKR